MRRFRRKHDRRRTFAVSPAALRSAPSDFSVPIGEVVLWLFGGNADLLYWQRRQGQPRRICERCQERTDAATTRYGGQHPTAGAHALPAALIERLARLDSCGWQLAENLVKLLPQLWTFEACKLAGWKNCSRRAAECLYAALYESAPLFCSDPRASVLTY